MVMGLVGMRPAEAIARERFGKGHGALAGEKPSLHMQHLFHSPLTATSTCTRSHGANGFSKLHLTGHPS